MLEQVESEVVRARERLPTGLALEWLLSRVSAVVTGEFIGTSEGPVAPLPRAGEWLLSRVYPLVSLEVGALCVLLGTVGIVTVVRASHL